MTLNTSMKWRLHSTVAATINVGYYVMNTGSIESIKCESVTTDTTTITITLGGKTGNAGIWFDGTVTNSSGSNGIFSFQRAQVSSSVSTIIAYVGSWMEYQTV